MGNSFHNIKIRPLCHKFTLSYQRTTHIDIIIIYLGCTGTEIANIKLIIHSLYVTWVYYNLIEQ